MDNAALPRTVLCDSPAPHRLGRTWSNTRRPFHYYRPNWSTVEAYLFLLSLALHGNYRQLCPFFHLLYFIGSCKSCWKLHSKAETSEWTFDYSVSSYCMQHISNNAYRPITVDFIHWSLCSNILRVLCRAGESVHMACLPIYNLLNKIIFCRGRLCPICIAVKGI